VLPVEHILVDGATICTYWVTEDVNWMRGKEFCGGVEILFDLSENFL
jgi:hypothetical protein